MNNISKDIAQKFVKFINSFDYDPYEVAMICSQVLNENNVKFKGTRHVIGINMFIDYRGDTDADTN